MPFSYEKPIIQLKKIKFQQICTKKPWKEKENVKKKLYWMILLSFSNNESRKQNVEVQVMHQKSIESHLGFKTSVQSLSWK